MKKILSITMAAVCALTVSAFGISACSKEEEYGEEVTAEGWAAAWSAEKMLNVTCEYTLSQNFTYTTNGTYNETSSADGEVFYGTTVSVVATELTIKTAFTDCGGYIAGNAYFNGYFNETQTTAGQTTDTSHRKICYEQYTSNGYSSVTSMDYGDNVKWSGDTSDEAGALESSYEMTYMCSGYSRIAEVFSYFEYTDGEYKYSYVYSNSDGYEYITTTAVKIKDGCLNTVTISYDIDGSVISGEMKFYDYGKTAVDIPEEYSYSYYQTNRA